MFKKHLCMLAISSALCTNLAHSQEQDEDLLGELSLEDLFSIDTDIAANTERSIFEQPSIISVITRDQILNSGARDLIDVMRMVPGFGFAHDAAGINSWGFRGIWGHEGKIMLMIDGTPYNDPAWGNLQFGRHYPVDLISKVEVIRGPGAAKFGNYAELAVVRVTTISGDKDGNDGGYVNVNVRAMEDNFGSSEISAAYSGTLSEDVRYSTMLHSRHANRTVIPLQDATGNVTTDQNNSPMRVFFTNAKLFVNDFTFDTAIERYNFEHNEDLVTQLPAPGTTVQQNYENFHLGVDYSKQINKDWAFNANILYQEVMSHDMDITETDYFARTGSHYRIETDRTITTLDALYQISENSSVSFGVEYFEVGAKSKAIDEYFLGFDPEEAGLNADNWYAGDNHFSFEQKSAFIQYENYNDIVNLTIGARFADHSEAEDSVLVPRIGLSKKWGSFGFKAMYSEAFRTGDAEHLNLAATQLKAETLDSSEVEFHYLHGSGLYTVNFFQMNIADPITYNTDGLTANLGEIQSSGVEAAWSMKKDRYDQEVTFSYYQGNEDSAPAQLANDGSSYLGFPTFKATWQMDYRFSDKLTLHPTIIYENDKYWRKDVTDPSQDQKIDNVFLVNLTLSYQFSEAFTLRASVHDLLNETYYYPQAYGQVLYPGESREVSISASYSF